jgi:hypothetical protein
VQQWIPDGNTLNGEAAFLDLHLNFHFGLADDRNVDKFQVHPQAIFFIYINQLGLSLVIYRFKLGFQRRAMFFICLLKALLNIESQVAIVLV